MKIKLLLFLVSVFLVNQLYSQNITITAPVNNGFISSSVAPNGTSDHTTIRVHFIIPAYELQAIPAGTSLDEIGVNIQAAGTGIGSGNLQFYLENTADLGNIKSQNWSNAIATMTSVYNGPFTVPAAAGPVDFAITSPFTYSGGGLYIAYEYVSSVTGTGPASYWVNNTLPNSVRYSATTTSVASDSVNDISASRPETRFTYINPFTNNLEVTSLQAEFGMANAYLTSDFEVNVEVSNVGTNAVTNAIVTLDLIGSNTYTDNQTIGSIGAGGSQILTFSNVPVGSTPSQVIKVSVPADQQSYNDSLQYVHEISCEDLSYYNSGDATSSVGFNTGQGILGVKYDVPNVLPVNITEIDFRVGNNAASTGNTVKGVLLNSSGVIVDSTASFLISASDLGQNVALPLLNGNVNYANQTVFAGIRQTANVNLGYFPLGMQEGIVIPTDRSFSTGINGGAYTYYNAAPFFPFMVGITIEPRPTFLISNTTTNTVCTGSPIVLTTFPTPFDNYTLIGNGTNLQTNTTGVFNATPVNTTTYEIELELNSCTSLSNPAVITAVTEFNTTLYEDMCSDDTFLFDGQALNTTGQYTSTLTAVGGCDSIITLNLEVSQTSTSTINASICAGDSYDYNGQTLTTSGTYTEVVPNSVGCDSTITLNLDVLLEDMSVSQNGATLTVAAGGAGTTYQWINCDNNNPIVGATSQSFTPTDDMGIIGNYAVQVTAGNCSETSPCTTINFTSVTDYADGEMTLFPNPVIDELQIQTNLKDLKSYVVFDATGKKVLEGNFIQQDVLTINTADLESGTYFLTLSSGENQINKVFVK